MAQDKSDTSFRVIDRRLFTEEGELRPEAQEQAQREKEAPKSTAAAPAGGKPAEPATTPPVEKPTPARSPYFDLLVRSLANQAAMLLTGMQDPATGQTMVDIEGAREVIDMLDALREKTRGNLAPDEERVLVEMLGSLKLSYLEMNKAAAAAAQQSGSRKTASRR